MKTIWKYPIDLDDRQRIRFRKGAQILKANMQGEQLCIWALVDSEAKEEYREIAIFGTGHEIPEDLNLKFISTVANPPFVWHIFEVLFIVKEENEGKQ